MNKVIKFKHLRKTLAVGGVTLSLCGVALTNASAANVLFNHSAIVKADQVAPSTTNIEIHKTMYDKNDTSYIQNNKIRNDGTKKDTEFPAHLSHYDPNTMGKIEFTLYDITDVVNSKFNDGKGLTGFATDPSDANAQKYRVSQITKSIQASFDKAWDDVHTMDSGKLTSELSQNEYLKGAQKVATKAIDKDGNVRFENVKAYDPSKPQKYHYYAAIETKTPQGFYMNPSEPLVFVNPYTNPNGDGFLDTTYLYPKNKVQKLKFKLNKKALYNGDNANVKELAGAKFQLYRGNPGSGTKVGGVLTADSKGELTADNLIMGDYYFVEVASDVAGDQPDPDTTTAKAFISPVARNNAQNKLYFTIDENGIDPTKLVATVIDYGTPDLTKKLTNGVGDSQSLHRGDLAHFKSSIEVPQNIMGSGWQIGTQNGNTEQRDLAYHVFYTRDVPQEHLKDVEAVRHLVIKTANGTTLKEGTDYEVYTSSDGQFFVNYAINGISQEERATLNTLKSGKSSSEILSKMKDIKTGHVSDTVAKEAGKKLFYDYDQVVKDDAKTDTDIVNKIYLGWNDGSGNYEIERKDKTITFGINFVKESSGFMGTGIGAQRLAGAQFVVQDLKTGKWYNGTKYDSERKAQVAQWVDSYKDVKEGILESDKDGKFSLHGFTEGDYKLREVKAPRGYQLMEETMNFHMSKDTDTQTLTNPIIVKNNEKTTMPFTGSQALLLTAGAGAITVTVLGYAGYKMKKRQA
ncbi:SpaA isopeptide-forming pilin-related protein [Lactobacillus jensenii]|uniref:SpaA isopeptide-forming pilin-related protein n=1 Tax=Lactobacillus jensenii TaxID=109790 RepID=UPI0022AC4FFC|nr:SpaA isopeptide-forming pilin-related protein [Lactobacillus jensenii]MCZ3724189.1 cell wall anchor protein [Lactobacillus jensenii]MCZ3725712.1 cell wall anchor protein [Lactobacillus jensenii]MCZ3727152.1 cell wall anchor protein [Lactobacillus jensenii]MCZ3728702.1 cell wall anchor protein [Lactobacillus jensenii]MCZ3730270.1 cell wall anchor protein [Lactobacillus jensenii]